MRNIIAIVVLLVVTCKAYTQEYKFGFLLRKKLLNSADLYIVRENTSNLTQIIGVIPSGQLSVRDSSGAILVNSGEIRVTKEVSTTVNAYTQKSIHTKLKGAIKERSQDGEHDTLFIKFWDITNNVKQGDALLVNKDDNGEDFMLVVKTSYWANHKSLNIPYRSWQFSATNLPFRVMTKSGELESEFLNANIAIVKVHGRTKIFNSEFIEPRNNAWCFGPYLGLSAVDNETTQNKEFGLNYGVNIIFAARDFNIVGAYGFQNGFKVDTRKVRGYFGFGIGFKLIEFFTPEIEKKE